MKTIRWNASKDALVRAKRGVGFEQAAEMIERGEILDVIEHWNPLRYPKQSVFVLKIGSYAYCVPFIETDEEIFLKTLFPSRRAAKRYLRGL